MTAIQSVTLFFILLVSPLFCPTLEFYVQYLRSPSHCRLSECFCVNRVFSVFPPCYPGCVGADVPETEAGSGKGEAASRAGALQEVPDAATDTLAPRGGALQGLPS